MSKPHASATVIISRTVVPGREDEFEAWLTDLRRATERAPGHRVSRAEPPQPAHPDEWLLTSTFATRAELDAWLYSDTRSALLARGERLHLGPHRKQVLASDSDQVTLVSSIRLCAGAERAYRAIHDRAVAAATARGGLVRPELHPAVDGVQPDTVSVLTFASRTDLDRWLHSTERHDALNAIEPLAKGPATDNIVGSFGGWFDATTTPRRWKQATCVLLGLIPVSILVTQARDTLAPDLTMLAAVALTAVANIAILTWIVMRPLTRYLGGWLER